MGKNRAAALAQGMKRSSSRSGDAAAPPVKAAMVRLNVGGEFFATTMDTLSKAAYFNPFLSGRIQHGEDEGAPSSSIVAPSSSRTSCNIFAPGRFRRGLSCAASSTNCSMRVSTLAYPASLIRSKVRSLPTTCVRTHWMGGTAASTYVLFWAGLRDPKMFKGSSCRSLSIATSTGGPYDSRSRAPPGLLQQVD